MKKLFLIIGIFIIALGAGAYFWRAAQPAKLEAKDVTPQELKQMIAQDDNFFVYIYSPTCPKCKKAEPLIAKAAGLTKVKMVALDVKAYPDMKSELQVTGTPTIYFYKGDKLAKGITGVLDSSQGYVDFFKSALALP